MLHQIISSKEQLTSLDDQVHADTSSLEGSWVTISFAVVDTRVCHANVGNLQTTVIISRASWQFAPWSTSPTNSGAVGSFVTALEDHLTTCG